MMPVNTIQQLRWVPWYKYTEVHMNHHMAQHSTYDKIHAFTWFDLELCYLLWHSCEDFQTICKNRIKKTLYQQSLNKDYRKLWEITNFENTYDVEIIHPFNITYQAQNLVYMFALWLVNTLDVKLIEKTWPIHINNIHRRHESPLSLDCSLPIFDSVIWMENEIDMDNLADVRNKYIKKRPLAKEIRLQWKIYNLKLRNTLMYDPSDVMLWAFLK